MKGIWVLIMLILCSSTVFSSLSVDIGDNSIPYVGINPVSLYGLLDSDNVWTGDNTFFNVTIINQSILNINSTICLNSSCISSWGDVNVSDRLQNKTVINVSYNSKIGDGTTYFTVESFDINHYAIGYLGSAPILRGIANGSITEAIAVNETLIIVSDDDPTISFFNNNLSKDGSIYLNTTGGFLQTDQHFSIGSKDLSDDGNDYLLGLNGRWITSWDDVNVSEGSVWTASSGIIYNTTANVGIGTSTPNVKLDVVGGDIRFNNTWNLEFTEKKLNFSLITGGAFNDFYTYPQIIVNSSNKAPFLPSRFGIFNGVFSIDDSESDVSTLSFVDTIEGDLLISAASIEVNSTASNMTIEGIDDIILEAAVTISDLTGSYVGGSAYVCVTDGGKLFTAEGGCP